MDISKTALQLALRRFAKIRGHGYISDVATEAGISRPTVRKVASGETVSRRKMDAIFDALGRISAGKAESGIDVDDIKIESWFSLTPFLEMYCSGNHRSQLSWGIDPDTNSITLSAPKFDDKSKLEHLNRNLAESIKSPSMTSYLRSIERGWNEITNCAPEDYGEQHILDSILWLYFASGSLHKSLGEGLPLPFRHELDDVAESLRLTPGMMTERNNDASDNDTDDDSTPS